MKERVRPINKECPQEREAALRLLRLIGDKHIGLGDILAHGVVDLETDDLSVCVHGIPMRCKVHR